MSSVPMMGAGNVAGLSLLGRNAESEIEGSPPTETRDLPSSTSQPVASPNGLSDLRLDPPDPHLESPHGKPASDRARQGHEPGENSRANGKSSKAEASGPPANETIQQPDLSAPPAPTAPTTMPTGNGNGSASAGPMELHRIREVREQQGLSVRSVARRLGVDVKTYRQLENSSADLSLSELHAVQVALDVPFADLLVDRNGLAQPIRERAKMIKVMKSAVAIREAKSTPRVQRLAQMLCEQLTELMPELADVGGWPQFGARRGQSALGKALREPIDTSQIGLSE